MPFERVTLATVVIANGGTVSETVVFDAYRAAGLKVPAAFTGTALTFQVSLDDSDYDVLYQNDGATIVQMTSVAAGRSYDLPAELLAFPYFRIVSGSAEAAARTLLLALKL